MPTLREEIDRVLADWSVAYLKDRRRKIYRSGLNASGELAEDFRRVRALVKADLNFVASVVVEFAKYGRFQDMRRITHQKWYTKPGHVRGKSWNNPSAKAPFVERIEEWINKRGSDKFISKHLANYPSRQGAPRAQLINRIAWGIVKTKQGGGKHRRRAWYFKDSGKVFSQLRTAIAEVYAAHGITDIKGALHGTE